MSNPGFKKFVNRLAFIGTIAISLTLVLQLVFKYSESLSRFTGIVGLVGQIIAYVVTSLAALAYVRTKRHAGWTIAYVFAVLVLLVMLIMINI